MAQVPNPQLHEVLKDITVLINEIENNPQVSSWVVRLALKSIQYKAEKRVIGTASPNKCLEPIAWRN